MRELRKRGKANLTQRRCGVALVEFAVVLPVVLVFIVGTIDVGRAVSVKHTLTESARAASRLYAVKEEVTEQDVRDIVAKAMADAGLDGYTITFDPPPSTVVNHLTAVTVMVSVPFDNVSLFSGSWFLEGRTLSGVCIMPADTGEVASTTPPSGGSLPDDVDIGEGNDNDFDNDGDGDDDDGDVDDGDGDGDDDDDDYDDDSDDDD